SGSCRDGHQPVQVRRNRSSISEKGTVAASPANVPCSAISVAAAMNPVQAARASAPPTLILRTPAAASAATVVKSLPTRTLTGLGATAATTAEMSDIDRSPGAYRQSAPASAY